MRSMSHRDDTHHDHGDGLHEDLLKLASRRDALAPDGPSLPSQCR